MVKYILIFAVIILLPLAAVTFTRQEKKRGCGRGCATCGNRSVCHRRRKGDAACHSPGNTGGPAVPPSG